MKLSKTLFIGLTSVFLMNGCSNQANTYALYNETEGFGGTGLTPSSEESGFGGTGVIGTIEAFGSIWVNGLHIHYDENVSYESNLPDKYTLAIGQQVQVLTQQNTPRIEAQAIRLHFPVAGAIQSVSKDHILVNNQWVQIQENTLLSSYFADHQLKMGDFVAVSGWQKETGTWVATRLSENLSNTKLYEKEMKWQLEDVANQFVIEDKLKNQLHQSLQQKLNNKPFSFKESKFGLQKELQLNPIKNERSQLNEPHSFNSPEKNITRPSNPFENSMGNGNHGHQGGGKH